MSHDDYTDDEREMTLGWQPLIHIRDNGNMFSGGRIGGGGGGEERGWGLGGSLLHD